MEIIVVYYTMDADETSNDLVPDESPVEESHDSDQTDIYRTIIDRQSKELGRAIISIDFIVKALNDRSDFDAAVKEKDTQIQFLTSDLASKMTAQNALLREVEHQRWLLMNMIPDYRYTS